MYLIQGHAIAKQVQQRSLLILIAAFGSLALSAIVLNLFPLQDYHAFYPHCPWHSITGTHCPGCGTVRGLNLMMHGDLLGLWRNNPLAMMLSPILVYASFNLFTESVWGYRLPRIHVPRWPLVLVIVIVSYWVVRNFCGALAPEPV